MEVKLDLGDMNTKLGTKGVHLNISDGTKHVGDLRIGKATVVWMKGRTQEANGIKIPLRTLLNLIEDYSKS